MMKCRMLGIGLIEVMVALAVLAAGVVALMKFQGNLLNNRHLATQQAKAVSLARNEISNVRRSQNLYLTNEQGQSQHSQPVTGSYSGNEATLGSYTVSRTIAAQTPPDYSDVTVTVTWTDANGSQQTVSLATKIADVDPNKVGEVMTEM